MPEDRRAAVGKEAIHGLAVHLHEQCGSGCVDIHAKTPQQLGNFVVADAGLFYNAHMTILPYR